MNKKLKEYLDVRNEHLIMQSLLGAKEQTMKDKEKSLAKEMLCNQVDVGTIFIHNNNKSYKVMELSLKEGFLSENEFLPKIKAIRVNKWGRVIKSKYDSIAYADEVEWYHIRSVWEDCWKSHPFDVDKVKRKIKTLQR